MSLLSAVVLLSLAFSKRAFANIAPQYAYLCRLGWT
jgi:hypothetical protein